MTKGKHENEQRANATRAASSNVIDITPRLRARKSRPHCNLNVDFSAEGEARDSLRKFCDRDNVAPSDACMFIVLNKTHAMTSARVMTCRDAADAILAYKTRPPRAGVVSRKLRTERADSLWRLFGVVVIEGDAVEHRDRKRVPMLDVNIAAMQWPEHMQNVYFDAIIRKGNGNPWDMAKAFVAAVGGAR